MVLVIPAEIAQTGLTIIRLRLVAVPSCRADGKVLEAWTGLYPRFLIKLNIKPYKHAIYQGVSGLLVRGLGEDPIAFFGTACHSTRSIHTDPIFLLSYKGVAGR
jgi:hypothetical protein